MADLEPVRMTPLAADRGVGLDLAAMHANVVERPVVEPVERADRGPKPPPAPIGLPLRETPGAYTRNEPGLMRLGRMRRPGQSDLLHDLSPVVIFVAPWRSVRRGVERILPEAT